MNVRILFQVVLVGFVSRLESNQQTLANDDDSQFLPNVCGPVKTLPPAGIIAKVLGGQYVNAGEMPWMVKLSIFIGHVDNHQFCGGFLISRQWVLTAGHCLEGARMVTVSAGGTNTSISSQA